MATLPTSGPILISPPASEPISVFVRGDNGWEIFVGLEDMVPNDDVQDCDPDAANAAAYDVQKIFRRLDIPWQWILDRLVGVVLGGSSCMVKNEGKGRKMTGFQRHQKIVVLMDILKPSQTSMAE